VLAVRVSVDPTPAVAPGKAKVVVVVPAARPEVRLVPALPTVASRRQTWRLGKGSAGDARSRCSRMRQEATLKSREDHGEREYRTGHGRRDLSS